MDGEVDTRSGHGAQSGTTGACGIDIQVLEEETCRFVICER